MVTTTFAKPSAGAWAEPVAALALPAGVPGPRQVLVGDEETLARFGVRAEGLRWTVAVRGLDLTGRAASGMILALGDEVHLRLTHRCETCATLRDAADAATLRALAAAGARGWLGVAVRGGTARPGDAARLLPGRPYPAVPDAVADRFGWVAAQIPPGRVMTYATMRAAIGAPRAYARALPGYARRFGAADRVVRDHPDPWRGDDLYLAPG